MITSYLESVKQQFNYYKTVGEKTFTQLEDADLFWQFNPESNSIAITVNHLWGNMMSRWTDFLTSDGEKPWRERDLEFEDVVRDRETMMAKWEEGWQCVFSALDSIDETNFDTLVYIRNQGHTIVEAVNRQLAHYAYHMGQIVYIGRMVKGNEWKSLTIPKGESKAFNAEKFAQPKARRHFTEDYLKADDESDAS